MERGFSKNAVAPRARASARVSSSANAVIRMKGTGSARTGGPPARPARTARELVVRDDGVVGAPVTNGDAARRQSVLVHRGREVLEELGAIAHLRAEQTPRIGVVLGQQEPSLAWGGLGRLEQDSAGLLGNARGLRLLLRPVHERLLEHATCQLQGRGMPTSRVARQWGRFPPNAGPRRKGSLWWGLRTAWGIPPQSRRWTPWMLNVGDRGRGGGTFPVHHTAQACLQASFDRCPASAPHGVGSGRQPRRPGGCGADRPPLPLPRRPARRRRGRDACDARHGRAPAGPLRQSPRAW